MAEALEGETDGVDEVDPGADQGVAQFEAQEIVLGLGGAVLDGMEQLRIHPGETGEPLGIAGSHLRSEREMAWSLRGLATNTVAPCSVR